MVSGGQLASLVACGVASTVPLNLECGTWEIGGNVKSKGMLVYIKIGGNAV